MGFISCLHISIVDGLKHVISKCKPKMLLNFIDLGLIEILSRNRPSSKPELARTKLLMLIPTIVRTIIEC